MTATEMKKMIMGLTNDYTFKYLGVIGSIIPISASNINISYGEDNHFFKDIDSAMSALIIGGKSLNQVR